MKLGIVGMGQTGILLAYALADSGIEITMIDAGDFNQESALLNRNSYQFKTDSSMPEGVHMVGGGATLWYGRVSKFPDYVFDNPHLGWPIKSLELVDYYKEVYRILGVGSTSDSDIRNKYNQELSQSLLPNLQLSPYFRCEPQYYKSLLASLQGTSNVRFLLNSPIRDLRTSEDEKIIASDFSGNEFVFDKIVIAGGTSQSTSLLLRSLPNLPSVKNQALVGKGLMEHFDGYVGCLRVRNRDIEKVLTLVNGSSPKKIQIENLSVSYGFGIKLSDDFIQKSKSRLVDFHLHFEPYQEIYSFGDLYFILPRNSVVKKFLFTAELIFRKFFLIPLRKQFDSLLGFTRFSIYLKGEEVANYYSTISIGEAKGGSEASLEYDHKISKLTTSLIRESLQDFRSNYHLKKLGKIKFFWWFMHSPASSSTGPNWHPMGTMPMHLDEQRRVVNSDLSLTGYSSIYMLNAGVFPSASYQNPATTTLALSLRLAAHISKDVKMASGKE